MTKSEFIQRVAIALAGNANFTGHLNFSYSDIVHKAEALADYYEDNSNYGGFEELSDAEFIGDKLNDIIGELKVINADVD